MKKLIVLLLIGIVVASGCVGQTPAPSGGGTTVPSVTTPSTTQPITGTAGDLTTGNAALYRDVDSIAKEAASINTTDLDTVIAPVSADDMTVD